MAVRAHFAVPAMLEKEMGLLHGSLSVVSHEGGQVHLEVDSHLVNALETGTVEVAVALRVGEQRTVAGLLQVAECLIEGRRRIPGGGLKQEGVVLHREKVTLAEPFVKKRVKHVLGCKVKPDIAFVRSLKFRKPGLQSLCGVGDVLHDVRGAPDIGHPGRLFEFQCSQSISKGLDAVVHTMEDVAVAVCASAKDSPAQEGVLAMEEVEDCHGVSCYFRNGPS